MSQRALKKSLPSNLETDLAPFDTAKRQQIMDGARRVFHLHGFDGASIGDVVRAAGVSKGTLYAYFASKEKLFEAVVKEDRRKQAEALFVIDEDDPDIEQVLTTLGVSFLDMLLEPSSIDFLRIVIGASAKFPDIGRAFYQAGPCFGKKRLADYLEKQVQKGILLVDDTELAAQQFLDLCKTGILFGVMIGHENVPTHQKIVENVASSVKMFLKTYKR